VLDKRSGVAPLADRRYSCSLSQGYRKAREESTPLAPGSGVKRPTSQDAPSLVEVSASGRKLQPHPQQPDGSRPQRPGPRVGRDPLPRRPPGPLGPGLPGPAPAEERRREGAGRPPGRGPPHGPQGPHGPLGGGAGGGGLPRALPPGGGAPARRVPCLASLAHPPARLAGRRWGKWPSRRRFPGARNKGRSKGRKRSSSFTPARPGRGGGGLGRRGAPTLPRRGRPRRRRPPGRPLFGERLRSFPILPRRS
jgi:hypothetical protein